MLNRKVIWNRHMTFLEFLPQKFLSDLIIATSALALAFTNGFNDWSPYFKLALSGCNVTWPSASRPSIRCPVALGNSRPSPGTVLFNWIPQPPPLLVFTGGHDLRGLGKVWFDFPLKQARSFDQGCFKARLLSTWSSSITTFVSSAATPQSHYMLVSTFPFTSYCPRSHSETQQPRHSTLP